MPTAQLVYDDRHQSHAAIEHMQVQTAEAYAALHRDLETALRLELAKLAPQDRRLFRAELAPIQSGVDHDTIAGTWTMWLECDPPRTLAGGARQRRRQPDRRAGRGARQGRRRALPVRGHDDRAVRHRRVRRLPPGGLGLMHEWEPTDGPYETHGDELVFIGTDDTPLSARAREALDAYERRPLGANLARTPGAIVAGRGMAERAARDLVQ